MSGQNLWQTHPGGKFASGNPGKPKGATGVIADVQRQCAALGFNPIEECIKRYRDEDTPANCRVQYLGFVMDRWAPKLKSVEHTGPKDKVQQVILNILAGNVSVSLGNEQGTEVSTIAHDTPDDDNIVEYQEVSTIASDAEQ